MDAARRGERAQVQADVAAAEAAVSSSGRSTIADRESDGGLTNTLANASIDFLRQEALGPTFEPNVRLPGCNAGARSQGPLAPRRQR